MDSLANRYARALCSIAIEENQVEEYQQKIQFVDQQLKENPDFMRILSSYFITKEEKHRVIDQVFEPLGSRHILSFLKLIIDHNRIHELFPILKEFHSLCNEARGIVEGIAYTVYPLKEQELKDITQAISKKMGQSIELKNEIDPRILGGVKVVIHDRVFDGSILHKVESLKQNLQTGKVGKDQ